MSEDELKRFGLYARRLRNAGGLTQAEVADRSGLSSDTIRRIEHGGFSPSLDTLAKFARGLGITMTTLFAGFEKRDGELAGQIADIIEHQPVAVRKKLIGALVGLISLVDLGRREAVRS